MKEKMYFKIAREAKKVKAKNFLLCKQKGISRGTYTSKRIMSKKTQLLVAVFCWECVPVSRVHKKRRIC